MESLTWKPESREASVMIGVGGHAYLFGGKNRSLLDRVEKLTLAPHPDNYPDAEPDPHFYDQAPKRKTSMLTSAIIEMNDPLLFEKFVASWQLLTPAQGSEQINGRFGHVGCCLKKRYLLFFGGERRYNAKVRIRECFNDLICFDVKKTQWGILRARGPVVKSRKYCSMAVVGQKVLIHGGLDDFGRVMADLNVFDLLTRTWRILPHAEAVEKIKFYPQPKQEENGFCEAVGCTPVAMAGTCSVFYNHRAHQEITLGEELSEPHWGRLEHYEGVYVFGGKVGASEETNQLKVLRFQRNKLKWVLPRIQGKPPEPRYQHSMAFYKRGNCLIIHGGRCDNFGGKVFSDMHILKLDRLEWVKVIYEREPPVSLFNHSCCIVGDHMLCYGGMKDGYKISNELRLFQLEQGHLNKKLNAFKEKLKRVFFTAIMKDFMHKAQHAFQEELEEKIRTASVSRRSSAHSTPREGAGVILLR